MTGSSSDTSNKTMKTLFSRGGNSFVVTGSSSQSGDCDEEEEDDILNLCSGRFTSLCASANESASLKDRPNRHLGLFTQDDESNDSDGLLCVLSGEFTKGAAGDDGVKSKDSVSAMRDNKGKSGGVGELGKGGEMAGER